VGVGIMIRDLQMRIIIFDLYKELTDLATIRKGLHAMGKIDEDAPRKKY